MQIGVAGAVCAVQYEIIGTVRINLEDRELVAAADMVPTRIHDFTGGQHRRVAIVALVERDLLDVGAVVVHDVQYRNCFALVLVGVTVADRTRLAAGGCLAARGLASRGEHDLAAREIGRVDVVTLGRNRVGADDPAHGAVAQVVFPDVPGRIVTAFVVRIAAGQCGGRATAHGKQYLGAVVRNLRIGDVARAVGIRAGDIDFRRAGRGLLAHVQVAAVGGVDRVSGTAEGAGRPFHVGDRDIITGGGRIVARAATGGKEYQ